jgi:hypothetical protein
VNGSVKFREDAAIWRAADEFRASAKLVGHNIPPIDVIYIAEIVLRLDVIPLENLKAEQNIDAALIPDLSGFYIDEEAYMGWEHGTRWIEQRLRFSFAHELGHYLLHREEIATKAFKTMAEFRQWAAAPTAYGSAEYQANEFAGRFLVPRDILLAEYDQASKNLATAEPSWREIEGARAFIAKKVAPRFGVNY